MTWKTKRLADLTKVITKGTTPTTLGYDFAESGVPFLRVQNIDGGSVNFERDTFYIDEWTHKTLNRSQIRPGDVLVSIAGTIGRAGIVPDNAPPLNCNQAVAIVRPTDEVSRSFLCLWFASSEAQRQMHGAAVTGTISNLSLTQLGNLRIPLPPLAEQRRIAEVLDRAEALRAKRCAAIAQLDSLTQSCFLDMFGNPATNPKGWSISHVGKVAEVQGGLQLASARKNLPREVPYLRVANVFRGFLNLSEIKTMRATDTEITRTRLLKDDLLIVEGHGNPAEIGRGALWDGSIPGAIHQNHLIRARFDIEKVIPLYACEYLNSPGGRRHLLRAGKTTSGLNTISVSEVRATPVAIPPLALQHEFARQVEAVEKLKVAQRTSLAKLDALFASLRSRAFKGEL